MSKQISNEQEFEDNLKKLGDLYEEGKDKLNTFGYRIPKNYEAAYLRMFGILKEMRDLAAVQMQHKHWISEN